MLMSPGTALSESNQVGRYKNSYSAIGQNHAKFGTEEQLNAF